MKPLSKTFSIYQTCIRKGRYPPIQVLEVQESSLTQECLQGLLDSAKETTIGIACAFDRFGKLAALALASHSQAILLKVTRGMLGKRSQKSSKSRRPLSNKTEASSVLVGLQCLQETVFLSLDVRKFSHNAHELALALHSDLDLRISCLTDFLSHPLAPQSRNVVSFLQETFKDDGLSAETADLIFESKVWDYADAANKQLNEHHDVLQLVQRAWISQLLASQESLQPRFSEIRLIDTSHWKSSDLDTLSQSLKDSMQSHRSKSDVLEHDFQIRSHEGSKLSVDSLRYNTRFKKSGKVKIHYQPEGNNNFAQSDFAITTSVTSIKGGLAKLSVPHVDQKIVKITSTGREPLSRVEKAQSLTILQTLQDVTPFFDNPWVQRLFSPENRTSKEEQAAENEPEDIGDEGWSTEIPWGWGLESTSKQDVEFTEGSSCDGSSTPEESNCLEKEVEEDNPWPTGPDPWSTPELFSLASSSTWGTSSHEAQHSANEELTKHLSDSTLVEKENDHGFTLNDSQEVALKHMLDQSQPITMIQGPPGTGKTSVIAAFLSLLANKETVWLVSKSNIAVKNIAEKLLQSGITNWKLLVSSDFYLEWHEHLYANGLSGQLLVSKDFSSKSVKDELEKCRFVLCTISMLLNDRLSRLGIHKMIPLKTLVVDEASQVVMGDYIPIVSKYGTNLKKMIFVGDDMQLPPFGADRANDESMKSVFQQKHLLKGLQFLDTQYRMPPSIGEFLSQHVYRNALRSDEKHPIQTKACCRLIDVASGTEEPDGRSWKNTAEVEATIHIAQQLIEKGKSFKILTPYDAQRNIIQKTMKARNLDWHDKCFNIDSFQGNEADYILISLVRTKHVGFIIDFRRTNVMLSRAKRGMIICCNRTFLDTNPSASRTLMGKMAKKWQDGWITFDYNSKISID